MNLISRKVNLGRSAEILAQFRASRRLNPDLVPRKMSFTNSHLPTPLSTDTSVPSAIKILAGGNKNVVVMSAVDFDGEASQIRRTEILINSRKESTPRIRVSGEEFILDSSGPFVLGSGEDVFEPTPSALALSFANGYLNIAVLENRGAYVAMDITEEPHMGAFLFNKSVKKNLSWLVQNIDRDSLIATAQKNNNPDNDDRYLGFPEFLTLRDRNTGKMSQATVFPVKIDIEGRLLSEHEAWTEEHFVTYLGYKALSLDAKDGFSEELEHFPIQRRIGPYTYNAMLPNVISDVLYESITNFSPAK